MGDRLCDQLSLESKKMLRNLIQLTKFKLFKDSAVGFDLQRKRAKLFVCLFLNLLTPAILYRINRDTMRTTNGE